MAGKLGLGRSVEAAAASVASTKHLVVAAVLKAAMAYTNSLRFISSSTLQVRMTVV